MPVLLALQMRKPVHPRRSPQIAKPSDEDEQGSFGLGFRLPTDGTKVSRSQRLLFSFDVRSYPSECFEHQLRNDTGIAKVLTPLPQLPAK